MEPEDQQAYELGVSYQAFKNGPAGKDFEEFVKALVDAATNAIVNCTEFSESTNLVIRYQQRKAAVDAITKHIDDAIFCMTKIREEEQNGNTGN